MKKEVLLDILADTDPEVLKDSFAKCGLVLVQKEQMDELTELIDKYEELLIDKVNNGERRITMAMLSTIFNVTFLVSAIIGRFPEFIIGGCIIRIFILTREVLKRRK